jgi:hypothetical protein
LPSVVTALACVMVEKSSLIRSVLYITGLCPRSNVCRIIPLAPLHQLFSRSFASILSALNIILRKLPPLRHLGGILYFKRQERTATFFSPEGNIQDSHLVCFLTEFKGPFLFVWVFLGCTTMDHRQLGSMAHKVHDSLTVKHSVDLNMVCSTIWCTLIGTLLI